MVVSLILMGVGFILIVLVLGHKYYELSAHKMLVNVRAARTLDSHITTVQEICTNTLRTFRHYSLVDFISLSVHWYSKALLRIRRFLAHRHKAAVRRIDEKAARLNSYGNGNKRHGEETYDGASPFLEQVAQAKQERYKKQSQD